MIKQIEQTLAQIDDWQKREFPRPAWLQKKADAVYLMDTDIERGLAMLADGILDERDALDKAKYIPYKPGAKK